MTPPDRQRVVRFVRRPEAGPTPDVFALEDAPVAPIAAGGFLVRNCLLSMDPALVGRMRAESNYADSVEPGEVMHAYGVGQVVASRHDGVAVGEVRLGRFDMQEFAVQSDPSASTVLNLGLAEAQAYLSVVGIAGATAWFAIHELAHLRAGETVVLSAGASAVGTVAAQLARQAGCRTVAIVRTPEKAERTARDWGYDAAVHYGGRSVDELAADLRAACPQGVDVYFDNTSGDISEALLDLYNDYARILVIGRLGIGHLADTRDDRGRRDNNAILARRITKQGMVLLDYQPRMMEAVVELARRVHRGQLRYAVDEVAGIDRVPEAFFRMLAGENQGKQLVSLAPIDDAADPAPRRTGRWLCSTRLPVGALLRARGRRLARPAA